MIRHVWLTMLEWRHPLQGTENRSRSQSAPLLSNTRSHRMGGMDQAIPAPPRQLQLNPEVVDALTGFESAIHTLTKTTTPASGRLGDQPSAIVEFIRRFETLRNQPRPWRWSSETAAAPSPGVTIRADGANATTSKDGSTADPPT